MQSGLVDELLALLGDGDVSGAVDVLASRTLELDVGAAACGAGCAHCCHTRVTATGPEILVLADFLRTLDDPGIPAEVAAARAATSGFDDTQRAALRRPCPILGADGRCRAYAVRPLACRLYFSKDAAVCAALAEGWAPDAPLETVAGAHRLHAHLLADMLDALERAGHPPATYELNSALDRALAAPDATASWLGGESVFEGAAPESAPDVLAAIRRIPRDGV